MIGLGLLAEAAQQATAAQAPADPLAAITSILAIVGFLTTFWQAKKRWDVQTMLHAAAVGLKAAMEALPQQAAEEIKSGIKEAVVATGGEALNKAMKAEVRKATTQVQIPTCRDDGLPKLGIMLAFTFLALSGCVGAAIHDAAVEARKSAVLLQAASVPNPAYKEEAEKAAWRRAWESHVKAIEAIEESSR